MSTRDVFRLQQLLYAGIMNIGERIVKRLGDLGWKQKDLLNALPELTPQALSALIKRKSKRSELDEYIASGLGVSVMWLVYGKDENSACDLPSTVTKLNPPTERDGAIERLLEVVNHLSLERVGQLTERALILLEEQPAKQTPVSLK